MLRRIEDAPLDRVIMLFTPQGVHRAQWDDDARFLNWWSNTADKVIDAEGIVGWMSEDDWLAFMASLKGR